jgi:hypothetical protein
LRRAARAGTPVGVAVVTLFDSFDNTVPAGDRWPIHARVSLLGFEVVSTADNEDDEQCDKSPDAHARKNIAFGKKGWCRQ